MRKHFLLLMLLTLLPLAGWAEDLSSASVAIGNVTYGTGAIGAPFVVWEGETLKGSGVDQQYNVDPNFYTKEGDVYTSKGSTLANLPVGTYYVKITGIPEKGFNGFTYGEFKITQKPLTVTFTDAFKEKLTKTYGQADPAQPAIPAVVETVLQMNDFKVTGLVNDESPLTVLNFGAANAAHYSYEGVNASTTPYSVSIINVSLREVATNDPELTSNYSLTLANDVTFTINKADFSKLGTEQAPAGMTWTVERTGDASKPYNATAQSTNYQVIYRLATAETGGVLTASDFKVEYTPTVGDEPDYSLTKKYVGTYKIKVTGLGTNFTGSKEFTTENYQFAITKASGLQVRVNVLSKTYDGAAFNANQARYTITGTQGEDEIVIVNDIDGAGALAAGVGQYNVKADLTNATIGNTAAKVADNYDITTASVTPTTVWTIIKRLATITVTPAENQTYVAAINYDDDLPTAALKTLKTEAVVGDRGVIADDIDNVKSGYTIGVDPDAINAATGSFDYFTVTRNEVAVPVLANYTITTIPGILQINGANLTVQPIVADLVYGTAPSPAISIFNGTTPLQLQAGATPTYVYSKDNATFNLTAADVKNVDRYYVKVDWNSIKDYAPAGYEITEESCISAVFDITKKTIKPTVGALTLHIGDNISMLQRAEATYADNNKKPAYGETPAFTFALIDNKVDVSEAQATLGKITGWHEGAGQVENTVANIITLAFANASDAANYTLDAEYVKGNLTLLNTYLLNLASDNLPALIQDAANNGNEYTVKLAEAGTLKGQTWYTMVLPFPVKTTELVSQLKNSGNQSVFAIVNVFDATHSEKGNIKFVMEWSEVPANTPFMIKTAEDVDLSKVEFTQKYITYKETPATAADADGDQFIGTYTKKSIIHDSENHIYYGWYDSNDQKRWRQPKSTAHEMQPLEAYLKYAPGSFDGEAPVITFEDIIDGNVTAIKTFTTEGGNNDAKVKEGWYTLNGVKLQGVPTEKGVYINNGKKIVIR